MTVNVENSIIYGKHKLSLRVSLADFYDEQLKVPKVCLEIDDEMVIDPHAVGRPLYFDTPLEALRFGKDWVDYRSGEYDE